jgi:hypothetical protein
MGHTLAAKWLSQRKAHKFVDVYYCVCRRACVRVYSCVYTRACVRLSVWVRARRWDARWRRSGRPRRGTAPACRRCSRTRPCPAARSLRRSLRGRCARVTRTYTHTYARTHTHARTHAHTHTHTGDGDRAHKGRRPCRSDAPAVGMRLLRASEKHFLRATFFCHGWCDVISRARLDLLRGKQHGNGGGAANGDSRRNDHGFLRANGSAGWKGDGWTFIERLCGQ